MNNVDHSDALAGVLGTALHCVQSIVPSELAAIYDLRGGRLEARSTVGSLASLIVGQPPIEVTSHPGLGPSLDDGTPVKLAARSLLGAEVVPLPDRVSLLVPLRCGDQCMGALVLVGHAGAYDGTATIVAATAAGHGLAAALAMARQLEVTSPLGTSLLPLRKAERLHLLAALRHTGGKIYGRDGAARLLDLKPTTLQSKLKKHGINRLDAVAETGSGGSGPTDPEPTSLAGAHAPLGSHRQEAAAPPAAE